MKVVAVRGEEVLRDRQSAFDGVIMAILGAD